MNEAAKALGKLSAQKRHKGKSKKEISAYYRDLRAKSKGKKISTPAI